MFDGTSDPFHHPLPSTRTAFPLHLSFPLHPATTPNINPFPPLSPPYNPSYHLSSQLPPNSLHPLHHQSIHQDDEQDTNMVSMSLAVDSQRPTSELTQLLSDDTSWSNDEVLALLRIRSSMESWFSDFAWEHVSRKMLEHGFKRSAQKCKDKFEEESTYFNASINYNKNYRFASELEELYQADHQQNLDCGTEKNPQLPEKLCDRQDKTVQSLEQDSGNDVVGKHYDEDITTEQAAEKLKRKRSSVDHKVEMFKCFCENIVNKIMVHQEEMHKKLIEDMAKRDEEKIAREVAWKKQQMDKMHKELDIMAHEQAVAGDRQATIIEFLKKFAATSPETSNDNHPVQTPYNANPKAATTSSLMQQDNPISHSDEQNNSFGPQSSSTSSPCKQSLCTSSDQNVRTIKPISSTEKLAADNPNHPASLTPRTCEELPSSSTSNPYLHNSGRDTTIPTGLIPMKRGPSNPKFTDNEDFGKRWPKDEVLALVNLRCSLYNSAAEDKEGARAPLWGRISQGMLELGYQRSSKRCKEKWENINKYFRKTKNVHKKRPLESRTCPYFHQLSALYSKEKLMISQSERAEDNNLMSSSQKQLLDQLHNHHASNITSHVVDEAEKKN